MVWDGTRWVTPQEMESAAVGATRAGRMGWSAAGSMTLRGVLRSWALFVIATTVVGGIAGLIFVLVAPASYASTVSVLVAPATSTATPVTINDIQVSQALAPTYSELASSRTLLQRVIAATGAPADPDRLASAVTTQIPVGTSIINITVTFSSPGDAEAIANEISVQLSAYQLQGVDTTSARPEVLTVIDPASAALKQGLGTPLTILVGAVVGLMLGISFAVMIENLQRSASTPEAAG